MSGLAVVSRPGSLRPLARSLARERAEAVLAFLDLADAELELTLVGDADMARLHADALDRTGPTNALALPEEDPERPGSLGEVVLCVDALHRECDLYGQDPDEHLTRLLAHSFLHLAGFDHGPEMDALTEAAVDALAEG
ncbi:rRNA maturation RNase YbeY [Desulfocurvus sp. DL9XJH121]